MQYPFIIYGKCKFNEPVLCSAPQHIRRISTSKGKADGTHKNRFSRSRFAGQYIEAGAEINFCLINQSKVFYMKILQHSLYPYSF